VIFKGWKGMETVFNEGIKVMGKGDTWYVLGAYAGEDRERTDKLITKIIKKCEKKKMNWQIWFVILVIVVFGSLILTRIL